jgi:uncharacterized protein (DUF952 family)
MNLLRNRPKPRRERRRSRFSWLSQLWKLGDDKGAGRRERFRSFEALEPRLVLAVAIDVGEHALLPNTPNQPIAIYVTGGDAVNGVDLVVQVADGGPEWGALGGSGSILGPAISDIDLISDSQLLFHGNNTGEVDPEADEGFSLSQYENRTTSTLSGAVSADGLLAWIIIDTTGFFRTEGGTWSFDLLLAGALDGAGVTSLSLPSPPYEADLTITNGLIILNNPPLADAGGPYNVDEGGSISLDGSSSTDPDIPTGDSITLYEWDLNYDGVTFTPDTTGVSPTFDASALDGPASRTIALRLTDSYGFTHIDTTTVTIDNVAPTASFSNDGPITFGQTVTVSFANQDDPSTADTSAGFKYAYATTSDFTGVTYASGSTAASSQEFSGLSVGNHTIYGRIIDKDDGYTQYSTTVQVDAAASGLSIVVGTHALLPNTPNQTIAIYVTGGDAVNGVDLIVQVADGGPEWGALGGSGSILGPAISDIDLISDSQLLFHGNNTGEVDPEADEGFSLSQYENRTTSTLSGAVSADGLLAWIIIDTTGFFRTEGGTWSFDLLLAGALDGAGVTSLSLPSPPYEADLTITNGLIILNNPPLADAGGPYNVDEGGSISLDGSSSTDPDIPTGDSITLYEWDLNYDGVTFTPDTTGVSPTFDASALDGPASRTIALRVTDSYGFTHIDTTTVTIDNVAPTASFSNDGPITFGQTVTVSFANQDDPSTADTSAGFKYAYATTSDFTGVTYASGSTAASSQEFSGLSVGSHTIYGRIIDKDDGYTQYSTTVQVDAAASGLSIVVGTHALLPNTPNQTIAIYVTGGDAVNGVDLIVQVADGGPEWGALGGSGSILGPAISDIDLISDSQLLFHGNTTGEVDPEADEGFSLSQYENRTTSTLSGAVSADGLLAWIIIDTTGFFRTEGGTWSFDLLLAGALDGAGVTSLSLPSPPYEADLTITNGLIILNNPPLADAGGPYLVGEGGSISLDGSASTDPDIPTGDSITLYEWDLDYDGSTFTADTTGVSPTFSAASIDGPASRTIALRVTDSYGFTHIDTTTVTIDNVAPTASFSNDGPITFGQTVTVSFADQDDPSTADTSAGFKYAYATTSDFTGVTYASGSTTASSQEFSGLSVGNHTIYGRIIDKDDGYTQYSTTVQVDAAASGLSIVVGTHALLPNTPNQTIAIYVTGGDAVNGVDLIVQVADGGPEWGALGGSGSILGPAISDIDLISDSQLLFHGNNTGEVDPEADEGFSLSQYENRTTSTLSGAVSADGLLAWIIIDTTGFFRTEGGTWSFDLLLAGALDGAGVTSLSLPSPPYEADLTITNGLIILNNPPLADAGGPYLVGEGGSISLDGSASTDPDIPTGDSITLYEWDLDYDGVTFTPDTTGVSPTFDASALDGPDSRTIALRVTDSYGFTHIATSTVTIDNVAPTATLSDNGPITYGQTVTLAFSNQFDPSTADTTTGFKYAYATTDDFTGIDYANGSITEATYDFTSLPAGTHTLYARIIDKDNGYTQYSTVVLVDKADATIVVDGKTVTYDGNPHGASGTAIGVQGEALAGLDLGASFINVPGGTANWVFTDVTGNYNDDSGSVAIVINKADATLNVSGVTVTYDGDAHGATGTAVGVKGETLAGLDLGASFTDVPGGTANWTFTDVTGNYNDDSGSVAIVINKADATLNVSGVTVTYDGDAHGATGTAIGVKGETLAGLDLGASFTNVPGGTANWTFTDVTGNYNDDSGSVAIVINKADATLNVSGVTVTYDGDAHGATGTAIGVKGETLAGLDLGASFTNVPGGTANWVVHGRDGQLQRCQRLGGHRDQQGRRHAQRQRRDGDLRRRCPRGHGHGHRRQGRDAGRPGPGRQLHQRARRHGQLDVHGRDGQLQRRQRLGGDRDQQGRRHAQRQRRDGHLRRRRPRGHGHGHRREGRDAGRPGPGRQLHRRARRHGQLDVHGRDGQLQRR